MTLISTARVNKPFHLSSSFKFSTWKKGHGINLANICGLVSLTFFIMTESKALFCHMCHVYRDMLILLKKSKKAKNKMLAY